MTRTSGTAALESSIPLRLVVTAALTCLVLLSLATGACEAREYPRLVNIYFPALDGVDLEVMSRYDLLVIAKRAQEWHVAELDELRARNPEIQIVAHMPVGYNGDHDAPPINADLAQALYDNNWWMRDTAGNRVSLSDGAPSRMLNMTQECPTNAEGKRLCDWLPEYIAERLVSTGVWDGAFLDYCVDEVSWLDFYNPFPMDHDLDGNPCERDSLDRSWTLGMRRCVSRLRELVGDDFILIANGNNTLYEFCDGDTREDFPVMHGTWYENVTHPVYGYLAFEALYRQPTTNIINTIWDGEVTPEGPVRSDEFNREFLLGLATTLVYGDGYFSCDGPGHCEAWWFEYYDIDLGQPLGRAQAVPAYPGASASWVPWTEYIQGRRFENGIAVVNPTFWIHDIDLGGAYYDIHSWNGDFYAYSGIRTHIEVMWYTGEVLYGSGVVPQNPIDGGRVVVARDFVTVDWDPIDGAERYSVYRSHLEEGGEYCARELVAVVDQPTFTDSDVGGSSAYRYHVAPIDRLNCEGQQSRAIEVSTEPGSDHSVALEVDDEHNGLPALNSDVPAPSGTALGPEPQTDPAARTPILTVSPQPARHTTTVAFDVADDERWGDGTPVTLTVYDVSGRLIRRLVNATLPAGPHRAEWDLRNASGARVASGCYLCVLESGGVRSIAKALVLR